MCYLTQVKASKPTGHGQELPKLKVKITLSLYRLIMIGICYRAGKLTNTG
jgi:hypothetical protein